MFCRKRLSIVVSALLVLVLSVGLCDQSVARGHHHGLIKESITHARYTREFFVHAPPGYNPNQRTPVVLVFHQENSNATAMSALAELNELSDQFGFLVVYPQGAKGLWNDERRTDANRLDDVGFVEAMLEALERKWHIDRQAVYAAGFGDGGFFVQYLALKLPGRVAAIASVAATTSQVVYHKLRLKGSLPVLFILGTDDKFAPWAGGPINPGRYGKNDGMAVSAAETVSFWVRSNKCGGDYTPEELIDADDTDRATVKIARYRNCPNGSEVVIYGIQGGGHSWPHRRTGNSDSKNRTCRDFDAGAIIFKFFADHGLASLRGNN
ncbi:MAG: hypothetical protein K2X93_10625 [Candidatus Obscuribacterales bacterium]|nr:hypothetical protein [Candidatus Obscuribacterales bacterium]